MQPSQEHRLPLLRRLAEETGQRVPERLLQPALSRLLQDLSLALCLHRVSPEDSPAASKDSIAAAKLDHLLDLLASLRRAQVLRQLVVCFDDGFATAGTYLEERAEAWPEVEWLFFVCPHKTLQQQGTGHQELATVETCQQLARRKNVKLGNHSNNHFNLGALSPKEFKTEMDESVALFEKLFGKTEHFAYPYGTPGLNVTAANVAALAPRLKYQWSTEPRPFAPDEAERGRLLPRFAVDGTMSVRGVLLLIAVRTLFFQTQRLVGGQP